MTAIASRAGRARTVGAAGVAFALAVVAHYEVLGYWFTGPDTLTLIETSRVLGPADAVDVLTKPLMHGTNFVALTGLFYRPVASLTYAIEYALWGLNPVGYHLTDLLLHAGGAALLVLFVREQLAVDGSGLPASVPAAIAGTVLAIHPLTAEVVPVPARRHDVLATAFLLGALWLLARGLDGPRPRPHYLTGSVLAYLLALGSKEIAAIGSVLVVWYVLLDSYGTGDDLPEALWRTVLLGLPYAVVSLGYLGLRVAVLGGLGGYVGPFGGIKADPIPVIVAEYLLSLFYPVDLLGLGARGLPFVPSAAYVIGAITVTLLVAGLALAGGVGPFLGSPAGRAALFYLVWLVLPLPLIALVGEYSPWSGYVGIVAVAGLAAALVASALHLPSRVRSLPNGRNERDGRGELDGDAAGPDIDRETTLTFASLTSTAVAGVLVVSLVAGSPLVYPYDGWERAGAVTEDAMYAAATESEGLASNAVVEVVALPNVRTRSSPTAEPRVKSLRYFWAHTVRSWIHLQRPDSSMRTFTQGRTTAVGNAVDVRATVERRENAPPLLGFRYVPRSETPANRSIRAVRADERSKS